MRQKPSSGLACPLLGGAMGDKRGLPAERISSSRLRKWWPGNLRHRFAFGRCMISDDKEHAFKTVHTSLEVGDEAGGGSVVPRTIARPVLGVADRRSPWPVCSLDWVFRLNGIADGEHDYSCRDVPQAQIPKADLQIGNIYLVEVLSNTTNRSFVRRTLYSSASLIHLSIVRSTAVWTIAFRATRANINAKGNPNANHFQFKFEKHTKPIQINQGR
jgi:hypothetical protein